MLLGKDKVTDLVPPASATYYISSSHDKAWAVSLTVNPWERVLVLKNSQDRSYREGLVEDILARQRNCTVNGRE